MIWDCSFLKNKNWIDSLKGIAILSVILVHNGMSGLESKIAHQIIGNAGSGVQLFFIISGYLTMASYDKQYSSDKCGIKEDVRWIGWKVVRLIPLYYLSLILSLIINGRGGRYWLGNVAEVSVPNIVSHFLFLHGVNPYWINSIIGGEWYIGTLVIIYLFVPLIYKFGKKLANGEILLFSSCVILFYFIQIKCFSMINTPAFSGCDSYILEAYVGSFSVLAQFPVYMLGVLFYMYITKHRARDNEKHFSIGVLLLSCYSIWGLIIGGTVIWGYGALVWGIPLLGLVISFYKWKNIFLNNWLFSLIGKYSYGMYLFHILIMDKIHAVSDAWGLERHSLWGMRYGLIVVLSFAVSYVLTNYFEKPIMILVKRRIVKQYK